MNNKILGLLSSLIVALLIVGCQSVDIASPDSGEQGAVVFAITRSDISSGDTVAVSPDDVVLRIYNSNDRLIARYTTSEIPDAIYLAAGEYRAVVQTGDQVEMSQEAEDICYYGEKEFTIVGGELSDLSINCTVQNSIVAVKFDQSVYDRFELEVSSYLCIADQFSFESIKDESVPMLHFSEDGMGYFILPSGAENISWGFYAESEFIDPTTPVASTTAQASGVIESAEAATLYTLNFKYTQTPDGYLGLTVVVDESVDEFDDMFNFSPQPTIKGSDFNLHDEGLSYTGEDFVVNVTSINDVASIVISSDEFYVEGDIIVMQDGVINFLDGVSYVPYSEKSGVLTLSREFFANFGGYGAKDITITAVDVTDSKGSEDMTVSVSGVTSPVFDLWNNTTTLTAQVILDDASDVRLLYRDLGSETWSEAAATKGDDGIYSAQFAPSWSEMTNEASLTYYLPSGGFWAESTYECKMIVDGLEYGVANYSTSAGHTIVNGDMESDSIKAFTTISSSSTDWASGNNTFASSLCKQATKGGSSVAYLKAAVAMYNFAAGNINYGQFALSGFSGDMDFGQYLNWSSRPKSLKFRYAATIGAETYDDYNLLDGYDVGRVYFAIVDWDSRHTVTAGTSGTPTGAWDPASQLSTDEGNIIGYASLYITESISNGSNDGLVEIELPIHYYDYTTKPTGNITIVLSCATSAYGDYMTGSTSSELWVDDFEFGY